jgi:hypothetical protein
MFVSNSDNLGATLDLHLLTYFADSNSPFMMECCDRSEADKKVTHTHHTFQRHMKFAVKYGLVQCL